MTWRTICDAWVTDLQTNVAGLGTAAAESHKYAPWSLEQLAVQVGERHFAVWPEAEAEDLTPLTTSPSQLASQQFIVLVWEDAGPESGRLTDDDTANGDWLDLQETVRARFFVRANVQLGFAGTSGDTRYLGCRFPAVDGLRVMELRFLIRTDFVSV